MHIFIQFPFPSVIYTDDSSHTLLTTFLIMSTNETMFNFNKRFISPHKNPINNEHFAVLVSLMTIIKCICAVVLIPYYAILWYTTKMFETNHRVPGNWLSRCLYNITSFMIVTFIKEKRSPPMGRLNYSAHEENMVQYWMCVTQTPHALRSDIL